MTKIPKTPAARILELFASVPSDIQDTLVQALQSIMELQEAEERLATERQGESGSLPTADIGARGE